MEVEIPVDQVILKGDLVLPDGAGYMVIFAHGSGSSRHSVRNQMVAEKLQAEGYATLLFDLLTAGEDAVGERRFDIRLISDRLVSVTRWLMREHGTPGMPVGYFGASTGAAAALVAAARLKDEIRAVVSRGGRPDLAGDSLGQVGTPVLLIVGGRDEPVIGLNEQSFARLPGEKKMIIIEGATHLFEETGKLETVAVMAVQWFNEHLKGIPVKG
ncbi:MAG TPA: alpha/beta fold hydrolase [Sphingobacteriaceae bacterium]